MLEERRIPYSIETVPLNAYGYKPAVFTRLVDGGKLPALELDGELHVESLSIMRLLDTTFPAADSSSISDGHSQRVAELFTLEEKLQRDYFSLVFYPVEQLEPFSKLRLSALNAARDSLLSTLREVDEVLARRMALGFSVAMRRQSSTFILLFASSECARRLFIGRV